ncbi:DUF3306 domain-containing protein [Bradyrhizobium manausense]|uniref:DUF3306 domain-containing protein n=1 Tax=Bradyrhizobium manausense TaxID=989370 RepID=UPI001BACF983|nr:DUF3306 domain-containing protein [Bradyrhizobium manausense]MBR0832194.1 DUF3306 domain-containing protein [Bradyrhizobium manausense]
MSEDKFLKRWSRRKQEARANATPPETAMHDDVQSPPPPAVKDEEPEFDLSSLPSLDLITSETDITSFLRKGIPQELKRAALRRAWSADPAICGFVGLAENAWDFNDPTAMPGFGPLDCSEAELAALVDRIVGGLGKAAQSPPDLSVEPEDSSRELHQEDEPGAARDAADGPTAAELASAPVAAQPAVAEDTKDETDPVRRSPTHGGALPS